MDNQDLDRFERWLIAQKRLTPGTAGSYRSWVARAGTPSGYASASERTKQNIRSAVNAWHAWREARGLGVRTS